MNNGFENKYFNISNINIQMLYEKISTNTNISLQNFKDELETAVLTMTERQQTVFDLLFNKALSKKEIAELLMISRSRINQLEKIIIRKIIMRIKCKSFISEVTCKIINNSTILSEINFSIRLQNCLHNHFGKNATLGDLLFFIDGNPKRILDLRNVGEKTLNELEVFLRYL